MRLNESTIFCLSHIILSSISKVIFYLLLDLCVNDGFTPECVNVRYMFCVKVSIETFVLFPNERYTIISLPFVIYIVFYASIL